MWKTNCSGWGLNAEYEFEIWSCELVEHSVRFEALGGADSKATVIVDDFWVFLLICSLVLGRGIIKPTGNQLWLMWCVFFFQLGKQADSLLNQGWSLTYMKSTANEPNKNFGYMQISKDTVVCLHHLITEHNKTTTNHLPLYCKATKRAKSFLKTGLLVKFTRCTFQCSALNSRARCSCTHFQLHKVQLAARIQG